MLSPLSQPDWKETGLTGLQVSLCVSVIFAISSAVLITMDSKVTSDYQSELVKKGEPKPASSRSTCFSQICVHEAQIHILQSQVY